MVRGLGLVLVLTVLVAGCSQPGTSGSAGGGGTEKQVRGVSVPANVPSYDVSKEERCPLGNEDVKCVTTFSEAKSAQGIEAITRDLWSKNQDENALIVTVYPVGAPGADMSGTGYAFSDRSVADTVLSSQYTASANADVEGQVDEAMANDGIYVISIRDEVRGLMQSVCASASAGSSFMPECTNY
jgi:hypothetical protein